MRSRIIQGAQKYYAMFGSSGVFLGAMAWLLRRPLEVSVSVSNLAYPVRLRLMTTDVNVFRDVILDAQYEKKFSKPPRVIVDAGANIGLASVFYHNASPKARLSLWNRNLQTMKCSKRTWRLIETFSQSKQLSGNRIRKFTFPIPPPSLGDSERQMKIKGWPPV